MTDSDGASDTAPSRCRSSRRERRSDGDAAAASRSNEGASHSFNLGPFTDPGTDSPLAVRFDWGDGSRDDLGHDGTIGVADAHLRRRPDTTTRSPSTVTDKDGRRPTRRRSSVHVNNVAPTIAISGDAERERGLGLQPDAGRGHRSGHGHGQQLDRPLGRRQQRHLRHERREDAHLRRRPERPRRHGRSDRRGRHVPRPRERVLGAREQRRADDRDQRRAERRTRARSTA